MSNIFNIEDARSKSEKKSYHTALYEAIRKLPVCSTAGNLIKELVKFENLDGTSSSNFSVKYLSEKINKTRSTTQHHLRKITNDHWILAVDYYEMGVDGKKDHVFTSFFLAPTVFTYGTPLFEAALAWTKRFNEKYKRPSVGFQKENGLSSSQVFATCQGYSVLNAEEDHVQLALDAIAKLKRTTITMTGITCRTLIISSSNTSNITKYSNITSMPDKPQSRGLIKQESNLIPEELKSPPKRNRHKVSEHYQENKKLVEALDLIFREFERLCFRTLSILEQHRFAGKLRERIAAGEGSFEQFLDLFKLSLKEIESSSVLRNSVESTLGRLYEAKKLKQFVFATDKARDNLVELHSDTPEKIPELLAIQAYEWGSNPEAVITDYFGDDVARDLFNESVEAVETVSIEEPVKGEDMHQECRSETSNDEELQRYDFMTIEEIAEEIAAEEKALRPLTPVPVAIEPKMDFNPHNHPIQTAKPPKDKSPRGVAIEAVVAHLTRIGAPSYGAKLRAMLESSDLDYIMHLYDNPSMIIVELTKIVKRSA